ncbi:MAG: hypothetical protein ABJA71_11375 [Ginsengibacter sp.]
MEQLESRKNFLKRCTYIIPSLLGIGLIARGCNNKSIEKKEKDNTSVDPCTDLSELNDNDLAARKNFNYVDVSTLKNKTCSQCNLYIPSKSRGSCGKCMLFKGPVQSIGSCTYWTQKTDKPG